MVDQDDGGMPTEEGRRATDDGTGLAADPGGAAVPPDPLDGGPIDAGLGDAPAAASDVVTISRRQLVIGAQVALVLLVVLVVALVLITKDDGKGTNAKVSSGTGGAATGKAAKKPEWPATVGGRPAFLGKRGDGPAKAKGDAPAGVYVWADFDGWHLWVVGAQGKAAAKGRITSDADFSRGESATKGQGTVTKTPKAIEFDFGTATDHVVGVDFNPGFFSKTILVDLDGTDLPVFSGRKPTDATSPLVFTKAVQG